MLFLLRSQIQKFGGSFNNLFCPVFLRIFYVVACSPVVLVVVSTLFQVLFLPSEGTLQSLAAKHSKVTRTGKCDGLPSLSRLTGALLSAHGAQSKAGRATRYPTV